MPELTSDSWQEAVLLPKFYEKSALSASGLHTRFVLSKFGLGYGLVDESTTPPTIQDIPCDLDKVPEEFFTQELEKDDFVFTDGRLLIRMTPTVRVDEPHKFSVTGIYDQDDDLVAVSVDLPDWVTPAEMLHLNGYITYVPELCD